MKLISKSIIAAAVIAAMLSGCKAPKQVPYLVEAETIPAEILSQIPAQTDPVIAVGDLLNIDITSNNMQAVAIFNKGRYIDADGKINNMRTSNNVSSGGGYELSTEYYLVNADGSIDFPIVGKIEVVGLTKTQVAQKICDAIYPKYVKDKPIVDIRLMNFRVTILGAVRSPGIYQSKNERMTFLEALSMAGDLDIKGERETIMLYRLNHDGTREIHRVDIHDKNFLLSPYYTLQQNDFIYVVPNEAMRNSSWQLNPAVAATTAVVGGISSIASLVVGIINLAK